MPSLCLGEGCAELIGQATAFIENSQEKGTNSGGYLSYLIDDVDDRIVIRRLRRSE
jgi:hypothetical protein